MLKIELIPLVMNLMLALFYLYQGEELGKILYWVGATVLTAGLVMMRG